MDAIGKSAQPDYQPRIYASMHYQSKQNGNLSITQQQLIALLPDKFTTREAMGIAHTLGVSGKTAERWLNDWTKKLDIQRISQGLYLKKDIVIRYKGSEGSEGFFRQSCRVLYARFPHFPHFPHM